MRSGIGDTLRAARRAQGRTLSDAAEATRVRETYLAAIEQGDFSALGGDVYARGFLRSYARYLGLDPEPLVSAYRAETSRPQLRGRGRPARRRGQAADGPPRTPAGHPDADFADPIDAEGAGGPPPRERPPGAAVLLLLVVLVLLVIAVVGLRAGDTVAATAAGGAAAVVVGERGGSAP